MFDSGVLLGQGVLFSNLSRNAMLRYLFFTSSNLTLVAKYVMLNFHSFVFIKLFIVTC